MAYLEDIDEGDGLAGIYELNFSICKRWASILTSLRGSRSLIEGLGSPLLELQPAAPIVQQNPQRRWPSRELPRARISSYGGAVATQLLVLLIEAIAN